MSENRFSTTQTDYCARRGVSTRALRYQISQGVVAVDHRGRIDPAQADAAWPRQRRERGGRQDGEDGRRNTQAKVLATLATLRLAQDRLADQRERYIGRAAAIAVAGEDVEGFLATLAGIPERHAAALAKTLGVSKRAAQRTLARFVTLAVGELGDLKAETVRTVEQV